MKANRRHTDLVLVGGGHAHVGVIRNLAMNPVPGVRITLVNSSSETPYSGMLPGLIAGQYDWDECHIDLARLCRWAGVRLIRARIVGLDSQQQRLDLIDAASGLSRSLDYDLVSLNPGATPDLSVPGAATRVTPVKPIAHFIEQFERGWLDQASSALRSVVVGAGVGAVEVVLAAQRRIPGHHWSLVVGQQGLLPGAPASVRRKLQTRLQACGIDLVPGPVLAVEDNLLRLPQGTLPFDRCLWNTHAAAPSWLAESGLPVDDAGFVRINPDLSVVDHTTIFAAGDAVSLGRPKAGVFAVRAGPVLADNLRRRLAHQPTQAWTPQRQWLAILNLADGTALGWRGGFSASGRWVWRLKDRIDRQFMDRFGARLPVRTMEAPGEDPPLCMGCGGKVPAQALGSVDLARDASRYAAQGAQYVTVDTLTDPIGDPWWMARLGAMHASGDLIAAGSRPQAHLVSVAVQDNQPNLVARDLAQVRAGLATLALGQSLGGHSWSAEPPNISLTLMGADLGFTPQPLASGMTVWVSRAQGSGLLLAGAMEAKVRGRFVDRWLDRAYPLEIDLEGLPAPVRLTDVTGFGLAGHLASLLGQRAVHWDSDLPELEGLDYTARPVLEPANRQLAAHLLTGLDERQCQLLCDPQTLGGLLAIWPADYQPPKPWVRVAVLD